MADRAMTLRFSADQADALEAIAEIQGTAVVEVVRIAVADYIEQLRLDPQFQEQLLASDDRRRKVMEGLRPHDRGTLHLRRGGES